MEGGQNMSRPRLQDVGRSLTPLNGPPDVLRKSGNMRGQSIRTNPHIAGEAFGIFLLHQNVEDVRPRLNLWSWNGGPLKFGYLFCLLLFLVFFRCFWLLASVASGFCGFWLSWLLWLLWLLAFVAFVASVAFGFRGFCGFCGFWLFGLSIYLSISICLYLSIYLSIFLSFFLFGSCSPFSFCICFSCCLRCRDETKHGSKQARKQASKHELLTFGSGVLLGGALRPPQTPLRHEICTSSPTPAPATKSKF